MSEFISSTLRALGFLSRISIPAQHFSADHRACDDAHVYPVAGLVVAFPAFIVIALFGFFPGTDIIAAILAIASLIFITGALHEDGLGDVADGFFATNDRAKMLEIMRDPHLGTFGTLALIISLLLKVASLHILLVSLGAWSAAFLLVSIEAVSRSAMVWHWHALQNARPGGKADQAGQPTERQALIAFTIGVPIFLGGCLITQISILAAIATTAIGAIAVIGFKRYCLFKLNGHTGDTVGATQQIVSVVVFVMLAIFSGLPT